MNILLVNYELYPQGGGAGLGTYNMAQAFAKKNHRVGLLFGWDNGYGRYEKNENIEYHPIKIRKKNLHQSTMIGLIAFVFKGLFRIRKLTKKETWDIIMFYFSIPTGILKYGIYRKTPYVISLRGMDIPGLNNLDYNFLTDLTKWLNKAIVRDASLVLSLSQVAAQKYNEMLPQKHIEVIPNSIEDIACNIKKEYRRRITKFVTVSRLIKIKRIDILIEAFVRCHKMNKSITLDIYGDGKEFSALQQMIVDLGANDFIRLLGRKPREKIRELLPEYDAFALFSAGDSFGVAYIEAMAAGLPVLCADAGGPSEIIEDMVTGIKVPPNSVDAAEMGIRYIIENPGMAEVLGKNGRNIVEIRYSINGVADQHLRLFEDIIAYQRD